MATGIAKTLQEKFGFMDSDINKPEHDDMIKWAEGKIEDIFAMVHGSKVRNKVISTKWEPAVRQYEWGGPTVGFVDLLGREFIHKDEVNYIVFEAKTSIDSLGLLFRQIRFYQEGYILGLPIREMPIVIMCPDDTHAGQIRAQRLHFLKYDPKMKFIVGGV